MLAGDSSNRQALKNPSLLAVYWPSGVAESVSITFH